MPYLLFIIFILSNDVSIFSVNCRKIRKNKNPSLLEKRHDDANSIRQIFNDQLPRRALVDILHKGQYFQYVNGALEAHGVLQFSFLNFLLFFL